MTTFTESYTIALVFLGILATAGLLGCIISLIVDWKKIKFVKPWNGPDIPRRRPLTRNQTMTVDDIWIKALPKTTNPQLSPRLISTPKKKSDNNNNNSGKDQNGVINKNSMNKPSTVGKTKTSSNNTGNAVSANKKVTNNVKQNGTTTSKKPTSVQQRSNLPMPDVNGRTNEEQELKKEWEKAHKNQRRLRRARSKKAAKHNLATTSTTLWKRKQSRTYPSSSNQFKNLLGPMNVRIPTLRESLLSKTCTNSTKPRSTITLRNVSGDLPPSKRIFSLLTGQRRTHKTNSNVSLTDRTCKSMVSSRQDERVSSQSPCTTDGVSVPVRLSKSVSKESLIILDSKSTIPRDRTSSLSSENAIELSRHRSASQSSLEEVLITRSVQIQQTRSQKSIRDRKRRRRITKKIRTDIEKEGIRIAYQIFRF